MRKSYSKDIQLLQSILKNQESINNAITQLGCTERNIEQNQIAFDVCSHFMLHK